jgi:hypothetical protein
MSIIGHEMNGDEQMTNIQSERFANAADAQIFFARMARIMSDKPAAKAHETLALDYVASYAKAKEREAA